MNFSISHTNFNQRFGCVGYCNTHLWFINILYAANLMSHFAVYGIWYNQIHIAPKDISRPIKNGMWKRKWKSESVHEWASEYVCVCEENSAVLCDCTITLKQCPQNKSSWFLFLQLFRHRLLGQFWARF